jgi:hypothetical protein
MKTSHSPYIGTNSIAVKLLQAAARFVAGEKQLALLLTQPLVGKLMADLSLGDRP